jgi:hypothetical protein
LKKLEIINNKVDKIQITDIIKTYYAWSAYSKSHDFQAMLNITIPNSKFSEITNLCKKSRALGIDCYYEFSSVKVIKIINTPHSALVEGNIRLIQSNQKLNFKGKFQSNCLLETIDNKGNSWKLNELEIDWEF